MTAVDVDLEWHAILTPAVAAGDSGGLQGGEPKAATSSLVLRQFAVTASYAFSAAACAAARAAAVGGAVRRLARMGTVGSEHSASPSPVVSGGK
eukprot:CAMPEP_0169068782 /NCGR_PEP_ID=MMETSP1015-20121227/4209_1 /TAXON_ID=342587 /ORGANISM="Karlodinium micrum, Strain CCMP2283" /LENGTH=93 /DNA_ID=CAMNT_0009127623 /DNA_START=352 /DNA_END=634 /DNA_ORIENTATION=+